MTRLTFRDDRGRTTEVLSQRGETVLEALERAGLPIPSSCRSGVCRTCLLRATDGHPPAAGQEDLPPTWRALGYFLSCRSVADDDLRVEAIDAPPQRCRVRVESIRDRGIGTLLSVEGVGGHGGQSCRLHSPNAAPRTLIVTAGGSSRLELWSDDSLVVEPGAMIEVEEPRGEAFYVPEFAESSLLIATDLDGWPAALGAVRDAEPTPTSLVVLLAFDGEVPGPLHDHLAEHPEIRVERASTPGRLEPAAVLDLVPDLHGWTVLLCGRRETLQPLRAPLFRAGGSPSTLHRVIVERGGEAGSR